jgi:hypothetical protein
MEEKRKFQRTEINEPAFISAAGSVMRCVVRNISPEGAALDVDNPAFVPPRFQLVMANSSSPRECTLVWLQQKRIGVAFVAPAEVASANPPSAKPA